MIYSRKGTKSEMKTEQVIKGKWSKDKKGKVKYHWGGKISLDIWLENRSTMNFTNHKFTNSIQC